MDTTFLKLETILTNSSLSKESQKIIREKFASLLPGEKLRLVAIFKQYPNLLGEMENLILAKDHITFEATLDKALGNVAQ